jgi:hypothetical protein
MPRETFSAGGVALATAGVEWTSFGLAYSAFTDEQREQVIAAHPRGSRFKKRVIEAFAHGIVRKPEATFGNVKADVLERMDPTYKRVNFCTVILDSAWRD